MMKRKIGKKITAWLMCLVMVLTTINLPMFTAKVKAEETTAVQAPSVTAFAAKQDLTDKKNFSLWKADGGVAQKVNFGNGKTWYIAGPDAGDLLVLICDPDFLNHFGVSPFLKEGNFDSKTYMNTVRGGENEILANHYGASDIRVYLNNEVLEKFSAEEKKMMVASTIETYDAKNKCTYSTSDKLYLADGGSADVKQIAVGATNVSKIGLWDKNAPSNSPYGDSRNGQFWTRTPVEGNGGQAQIVNTGDCTQMYGVDVPHAVVPVFHLDLKSVLFASAASAASSNAKLDDAMTFRIDREGKVSSTAIYSGSGIKITKGAPGEYIYIQYKDATGDKVWSKEIIDNMNVSAEYVGVDDFANCKIWIERKDNTENLTYAVMATRVENCKHDLVNITKEDSKRHSGTCTICESDVLLNHNFDEKGVCKECKYECTHEDEGGSTFVNGQCSNCNYNCAANGHVRNTNKKSNKNALEHEFTCSVCGETETENHHFESMSIISHRCVDCAAVSRHDVNGKDAACLNCGYSDNDPAMVVTKFATPQQLMNANNFALYKENADSKAVAQKVSFGNEKTWYIAGADKDGSLVLICDPTDPFESSVFCETATDKTYDGSDWGTYATPLSETSKVHANHYGASDIRAYLKSLYGDGKYDEFTNAEQDLMINTRIYTDDGWNDGGNAIYSTSDKLYLAYGDRYDDRYITVGTNGDNVTDLNKGIKIGIKDNGSKDSPFVDTSKIEKIWLRAPYGHFYGEHARIASLGDCVEENDEIYLYNKLPVVPAFNMDMTSVLFASAATTSSSAATFSDAMTFRIDRTNKVTSSAVACTGKIYVTKGTSNNEYLYLQGKDGETDWVYSKQITDNETISAGDIQSAKSLINIDLTKCIIWIETTDDNVTYAKEIIATGNHDFSDNGTCVCGLTQIEFAIASEEKKLVQVTGPNRNLDMTSDLVIPRTVKVNGEDYTVDEIVSRAFENCEFTGKLTIPNSVKKIGNHAFNGCKFTGELIISDSVEEIGECAFAASGFTGKLAIGKGLTNIASNTFSDCGFTGVIDIPNNVITVGTTVFANNEAVEKIYIPCSMDASIDFGVDAKKLVLKDHNFADKECTVCHVKECVVTGNHDFSVFVDDTKHKCSLCSVEEEHTLGDWKQADDGHYKTCSVCKKDTTHIAHTFSDTFTQDKHTCDVCGAEENHRFGADGKADQCEACHAKNINAASLDDKVVSDDVIYTGKDITSDVTMTGLTKNVDYTVANVTQKEVGEYTVTITGKGNYVGTREVKWSIVNCTHPTEKVVVEHKTLPTCETKGEDLKRCTVCNKVVEEGIIVEPLGHDYVDGICSRCGVVSFELNINKDILINGVNVVFDGQEHTSEMVVTYKGEPLTKDVDYTATTVTAKKVGSYDVTVTGIGKYRGEVIAKWSVIHPENLWCEDITDQMYTGSIIKPTVEVYADGMLLQSGVDYTIAYGKNNTNVADKEAKNKKGASIAPAVTITGKGNYSGKITKTFSIVACDFGAGEVTASVDDMTVAYNNGNNIKINPVVTYNNKPLKAGKDYVVSKTVDAKSKDDVVTVLKDAETYNLYIVGQGNYSGAVPFKVVITKAVPASKVVVAKIPDQKYADGNAVTPNDLVKVTFKGKDVKDQFDISYQNNTEVGTATLILTAKESSGKEAANQEGIVQEGAANGGADKAGTDFVGSKKVTFKIVGEQVKGIKLGADGKGKIDSYVYTGNACEPGEAQGLVLYAGSTKLAKDVDYTVTYEKNINVGTANAVITGKGKYTGTKKFAYKITAYDAAKDETKQLKITEILDGANHSVAVTDESNITVTFEKGATTPKPVVTFNGKTLEEKKDYTVAYANNKAVADKTATKAPTMNITFKGNYTGKKAVTFTIAKKNIAETTIAVSDMTVSTKANGWKQTKAMITDTNGKKLAAGADYEKNFKYYQDKDCTVEITDEVLATMGGTNGTLPAKTVIYVKVTGLNNYADSFITGSYRIAEQSIAAAKAVIATKTFTGKPICPKAGEITVTIGSGKNAKTLVAGTDFEVVANSYKNNVNKGNATVTIRGIGNYCGTKDVKFVIKNKSFRWWFEK